MSKEVIKVEKFKKGKAVVDKSRLIEILKRDDTQVDMRKRTLLKNGTQTATITVYFK